MCLSRKQSKMRQHLLRISLTSAAGLLILQNVPKISSNKTKLNWCVQRKCKASEFGKSPSSVFCTKILLPIEILYLRSGDDIIKELEITTVVTEVSWRRPVIVTCWGQVYGSSGPSCTCRFLSYHDPVLLHAVTGDQLPPSTLAPTNPILLVPLNLIWPQQGLLIPASGRQEDLLQAQVTMHFWSELSIPSCAGAWPTSTAFPCAFSSRYNRTPSTWCNFRENSFKMSDKGLWIGFGQHQVPFSQQYLETQVQGPSPYCSRGISIINL